MPAHLIGVYVERPAGSLGIPKSKYITGERYISSELFKSTRSVRGADVEMTRNSSGSPESLRS